MDKATSLLKQAQSELEEEDEMSWDRIEDALNSLQHFDFSLDDFNDVCEEEEKEDSAEEE